MSEKNKDSKWSKYEVFYIYDNPVKYKELEFFPATMKDYLQFHWYAQCLTLDKNSSRDPKIISMTYLDYMYTSSNPENPYFAYFDALLKIVLRKDNLNAQYGRNAKGKAIFVIEGKEYSSTDFEEIKKIISEYNSLELPDDKIQKEIRDNMEEAKRLRAKMNGNVKMASLEDQIVCVLISTSMSLEKISSLSIRKFLKILERVDAKLHYEIYLSASMSGFVEFKDKSVIKHWMSDLTKNKLDLVPLEQIQGTVSGKNAKVRNKK